MKKKVFFWFCIFLAVVFLIPIPRHLDDGGTVEYNAILYQVEDVHRMFTESDGSGGYIDGTIVRILGIEVYNDVE